jgi:YD repeat-containing protein
VTRFGYDAVDRLASTTDAAGRTTGCGYDTMSRLTQVFNPTVQAAPLLQQGYTPDGLRASLTDGHVPTGNTTSFAYDGLDRLATRAAPSERSKTHRAETVRMRCQST